MERKSGGRNSRPVPVPALNGSRPPTRGPWTPGTRLVAGVPRGADAETVEAAGRREPGLIDTLHPCTGRTVAQRFEQRVEGRSRALGDTPHGAVRFIGDPAAEIRARGEPEHEIAEADALDAPADDRLETL
jgi:hypothetical protein